MQAQNGQILYLGAKKKGNNQVDISFFEALSKSLNWIKLLITPKNCQVQNPYLWA